MKTAVGRWFLMITVFAGGLVPALGQRAELAKEEYDQRLKYLNNRHRDFYLHRQEKERQLRKILGSADEIREKRKQADQQAEKRRQAFVKERAAQPTPEDFEPQFLKQVEARERATEQERKKYVQQQEMLKRIRDSARAVPEAEDTGLVDPLESLR